MAPAPRPSSSVAKRTSSVQNAELKMLRVAQAASESRSSRVRAMKRKPEAMPPASAFAPAGASAGMRLMKSAEPR